MTTNGNENTEMDDLRSAVRSSAFTESRCPSVQGSGNSTSETPSTPFTPQTPNNTPKCSQAQLEAQSAAAGDQTSSMAQESHSINAPQGSEEAQNPGVGETSTQNDRHPTLTSSDIRPPHLRVEIPDSPLLGTASSASQVCIANYLLETFRQLIKTQGREHLRGGVRGPIRKFLAKIKRKRASTQSDGTEFSDHRPPKLRKKFLKLSSEMCESEKQTTGSSIPPSTPQHENNDEELLQRPSKIIKLKYHPRKSSAEISRIIRGMDAFSFEDQPEPEEMIGQPAPHPEASSDAMSLNSGTAPSTNSMDALTSPAAETIGNSLFEDDANTSAIEELPLIGEHQADRTRLRGRNGRVVSARLHSLLVRSVRYCRIEREAVWAQSRTIFDVVGEGFTDLFGTVRLPFESGPEVQNPDVFFWFGFRMSRV